MTTRVQLLLLFIRQHYGAFGICGIDNSTLMTFFDADDFFRRKRRPTVTGGGRDVWFSVKPAYVCTDTQVDDPTLWHFRQAKVSNASAGFDRNQNSRRIRMHACRSTSQYRVVPRGVTPFFFVLVYGRQSHGSGSTETGNCVHPYSTA